MNFRRNDKIVWLALGVLLFLIMMPCRVLAVPREINYQGYLTDPEGNPVNDSMAMTFRIWDEPSGGTLLWSESHEPVTLREGVFNVVLGLSVPILSEILEGECYLGITVGEDDEMVPRRRFTSTPFALRSARADDAGTLDGRSPSDFAEALHGHAFRDITGMAGDEQIPNDITIEYAATAGTATTADTATFAATADMASSADYAISAGAADTATTADNSDTVDGRHASAFAEAGHTHDTRYYTEAEVDAIVTGLATRIAQLESLLQNVSRSGNNITFSGVNLRIVNGTGTTDGAVNGLGNLIVGYNESRGSTDNRSGSHNIVVGSEHNYASYGGLVVGNLNTISGAYASVSGGWGNQAIGQGSSLCGGRENKAEGDHASVSGGSFNVASGYAASVSGGAYNTAYSHYSTILGGESNVAGDTSNTYHDAGQKATVSGGFSNTASGLYSSVGGGSFNKATATNSSISGGASNTASGNNSSVSGGDHNTAYSHYSSILGGEYNVAGITSGGHDAGQKATVSGGNANAANGPVTHISGGRDNIALGWYSVVSGGKSRTVLGTDDWQAGGYFQDN